MMKVVFLTDRDKLWNDTAQFAAKCSWRAGTYLAKDMRESKFADWERVLVALVNNKIAGFCTLAKKDCIPNVTYLPYIGYVFVGEEFRGNRISEKMITHAMKYAKKLGFDKVYLVSDQVNLYEKYGFVKIDEKLDLWGHLEKIYAHKT